MIKFTPLEIEILNACYAKRPELRLLVENYGDLTLEQYSSKLIPKDQKITKTFKDIIQKISKRYLGEDGVSKSLDVISAIDTSGHGGILSEDCSLQGHMIISEGVGKQKVDHFLSLSCGVVPMNNITWPRGFYLNGERISLFSKSVDRLAFHEVPSFTKEQLSKRIREGESNKKARDIFEWIDSLHNIYNYSWYYEQCVAINASLWNLNFRKDEKHPKFTQLMLEEVTLELIIDALENDSEFINFIFDKSIITDLLTELSDLPGTWNRELTKGTFLFWHRSGDFRSASMFLDGDKLKGKGIEVGFTPNDLIDNLKAKTIIPSVFLSLIMLIKHGVRPLGGYHQCWYLPQYVARLRKILTKHESTPLTFIHNAQMDDLVQVGYGLAFYKSVEDERKLAGLETFFQNPDELRNAYQAINKISVKEGIRYALKKWYQEIIPISERKLLI